MKKLSLSLIFENSFNIHSAIPNDEGSFSSFIFGDKEIKNFWKNRYGSWAMTMLDAAEANYEYYKRKTPGLTPEKFFEMWIDKGMDLEDAQSMLGDESYERAFQPKELIAHLKQQDRKI